MDLLIAQELYAFADLNLNAPSLPGFFAMSPLRRRPIAEWLVNIIVSIFMMLMLSQAFAATLSEKWQGTTNVVVGVLILLVFIFG